MVKAIFFDIDGTLVSFETHRMPESTRRALDTLRGKGILLFVATGRHVTEVRNLGEWKPDGLVTLNGAYCTLNGEVIYKKAIDPGDVSSLVGRLQEGPFHPFIFVAENGMWFNNPDERVLRMLRMVGLSLPEKASLDELYGMEIFQMMGFFEEKDEAEAMKYLPGCHATRWTSSFADIIPRGTDKWHGIGKILERFGIAREDTMAFGDGGNDISMLRGAGTGIAMGNAGDDVKAAADYVTTSVDDDGIAKALEHFGIL